MAELFFKIIPLLQFRRVEQLRPDEVTWNVTGPPFGFSGVHISSTFSVLRPFSYLSPFLYFDPPTLLWPLYFDQNCTTTCTAAVSEPKYSGRSRVIEVQKRSNVWKWPKFKFGLMHTPFPWQIKSVTPLYLWFLRVSNSKNHNQNSLVKGKFLCKRKYIFWQSFPSSLNCSCPHTKTTRFRNINLNPIIKDYISRILRWTIFPKLSTKNRLSQTKIFAHF